MSKKSLLLEPSKSEVVTLLKLRKIYILNSIPHEKINQCLTNINQCLTNIFKT